MRFSLFSAGKQTAFLGVCLAFSWLLVAAASAATVGVTVGSAQGQQGDTVQIPVSLSNVPFEPPSDPYVPSPNVVVGIELVLTYDPSVVRVPMSLSGTDPVTGGAAKTSATQNWSLEQNALLNDPSDLTSQTGTLKIALANDTALAGDGDILTLDWEIVGSPGDSSPISVQAVHLYPSTGEQDEHTADPVTDGKIDVVATGPGIIFTFANGRVTGGATKYYEFDVMARCTESGTLLGDTLVYINYSTAGFGQSLVANSKIQVTKGTLLQGEESGSPLYEITNVVDNTPSRVAVTAGYRFGGAPSLANALPTTPTQLLHVQIEIADTSQTAGLNFQRDLMVGQQYQSDNTTKYTSVTASDTDNSELTPQAVLKIRVWLGGAYDPASDAMTTTLNTDGTIPLTSPYNQAAKTAPSIPAGVTDWVLVELRDTTTNIAAVDSFFLRSDGYVADMDGTTMDLILPGISAGDYYVVIRHRNHLSVMTSAAFTLSAGSVTTVDFTMALDNYYGNSADELETGVYGMFAGDANSNGQVQNDDKNDFWKPQSGSAGYKSADFNLNGQVQNDDKNDIWKANVGLGTQVP